MTPRAMVPSVALAKKDKRSNNPSHMRTEKCRNVIDSHQIKESTLDIEVGPKLVSIQERQGSVRSALQFK